MSCTAKETLSLQCGTLQVKLPAVLAPAGRAERAKYDFEIYFTTDPNSKVTLTCPKLTLPPTVETATARLAALRRLALF